MNSFQAAGFPFANTDLTKVWVNFELPSLSIGALLEAHRKNAAALTSANQVVFDGLKTLAQHQSDLFKTTVDDFSKVNSDVLAGVSFEERVAEQADAARHIYVSSVAHFRELSDTAVKANVTAVDILNARVTEAFDEFRALFAAPVAPTTATSVAPTSVIAEPVAVVEEVAPVGDAVDPVELKPTFTAAAPTARKKAAPAAKSAAAPTARKKAAPAAKSAATTTTRKTAAPAAKAARRPTLRGKRVR
jgi:phasin family protein